MSPPECRRRNSVGVLRIDNRLKIMQIKEPRQKIFSEKTRFLSRALAKDATDAKEARLAMDSFCIPLWLFLLWRSQQTWRNRGPHLCAWPPGEEQIGYGPHTFCNSEIGPLQPRTLHGASGAGSGLQCKFPLSGLCPPVYRAHSAQV